MTHNQRQRQTGIAVRRQQRLRTAEHNFVGEAALMREGGGVPRAHDLIDSGRVGMADELDVALAQQHGVEADLDGRAALAVLIDPRRQGDRLLLAHGLWRIVQQAQDRLEIDVYESLGADVAHLVTAGFDGEGLGVDRH